jgi:hypothetical protein
MAHKEFHLRANEVRAESRALMLKLRTERLAKSRYSKKPLRTDAVLNAEEAKTSVERALLPKSATLNVKASVKAVVSPRKQQSTIIVSRKVNAAVAPIEGSVSRFSEEEVSGQASSVLMSSPVVPVSGATPIPVVSGEAPTTDVSTNVETKPARKIKTVKSKPCDVLPSAKPLTESPSETAGAVQPSQKKPDPAFAAALVEAGVLEITGTRKRLVKNSGDVSVASKSTKLKISKPKLVKTKRELRPVDDIPVEGMGTVAELMEAVAASVRRPRADGARKTPKPAEPSGRALVPVSTVPSLGPGMVWRLNQIGVKTLADLASIEPDELRSKLGPVAKLVRVENWIAFAKAA